MLDLSRLITILALAACPRALMAQEPAPDTGFNDPPVAPAADPPAPVISEPVPEPAPVIVPRSFAEDRLPEEFFDKRGDLKRRLSPVPGMEPPVEYEASTKPVVALWVSGIAGLGGGYLISAFGAGFGYALSDFCLFSDCEEESDYLLGFIPLFGGFAAASKPTISTGMKVIFVTAGVFQNAGVALLISGLAAKQPVWVLKDKTVALEVGPGSVGLSGTF